MTRTSHTAQPARFRLFALTLTALAGLTATAQGIEPTIEFAPIATPASAIRPLGNRPAMHGDLVAFYGYQGETYATDVVIAAAMLGSEGGYTILAQEGDERLDEPGSVFDSFANPAVYNGHVVFLGGEFGTLPSTYGAIPGQPITLYDEGGINNPFYGPLGVSTPANPRGIALIDNNGARLFMGQLSDPMPCGSGTFGFSNVPGLQHVAHGGRKLVWPTYVSTTEYDGNAIVGYDADADEVFCIANGLDTIPDFGGPFDFFFKADTNGQRVAFIGMDPNIGFNRHEGVYLRDASGVGPITTVADTNSPAPSGGMFGSFDFVSIDGDLVIFQACAGGTGGCATYGFFGCFLDNGVPGPVFEILTTSDTIGGLGINDLNMSVTGRDGDRFAFDVRHGTQAASLYVATITRTGPDCPADLTGDGNLDFFDVSAFLNAFNASDPIADLTEDGSFDFFDVSAFLNAFNAGCP